MGNLVSASAGGKARAISSRQEALQKYYLNPNKCLFCEKIMEVGESDKVSQIKIKKFCNHSCSAKYNNSKKSKQENITYKKCECCQDIFDVSYLKSLNGRNKRKYCNKCNENYSYSKDNLNNITKKELFQKRKNWQSARSCIRRHAEKVFEKSGKEKKCLICGYTNYVEICHIKSVSDFEGNVLIKDINDIDNLVPLCPNHHWEFDHDLLKINISI